MLRAFLDARADRRRQRVAQSLSIEHARSRAARGAALLDDEDPGWAANVDPHSLQLSDGQACVLGQLHGDYRRGLTRSRAIDASSAPGRFVSPIDLGFQAVREAGADAEALDYAFLTRAWREEVEQRRPDYEPGGAPSRRTEVPQRLQ